jgi:hypothetical protein
MPMNTTAENAAPVSMASVPPIAPVPSSPMPPGAVTGPAAWTGDDMRRMPERWTFTLDAAELAEIEAATAAIERSGAPLGAISPATFTAPKLAERLRWLLDHQLLNGPGFAVLRGLPMDDLTIEQAAIAYLGVGSHLGSFRSQNAKGHLLGHVRDLGLDIREKSTRYYQTTRQLDYHTDSCDIVGLLCLKTSKSGGASRIVSSVTLYNEILARRPDLLPELFHAFPTDRRGEIPPGMLPWFEIPVFNWYEGNLSAIYSGQYIRSAQVNHPGARRLTVREHEALDLLDALADEPRLRLEMAFLPGDMQFLHNHQVFHSRTDFEDWPEPERKRHLLRLWVSPPSGRPLPQAYASRYGSIVPGERGGILTSQTELKFVTTPE